MADVFPRVHPGISRAWLRGQSLHGPVLPAYRFQGHAPGSAFRLRLEVRSAFVRLEEGSALRAAAPLAVHEAQLRWMNLMAALCAGCEERGSDLLWADLTAAGHALILRPSPSPPSASTCAL